MFVLANRNISWIPKRQALEATELLTLIHTLLTYDLYDSQTFSPAVAANEQIKPVAHHDKNRPKPR